MSQGTLHKSEQHLLVQPTQATLAVDSQRLITGQPHLRHTHNLIGLDAAVSEHIFDI